MCQSQAKTNFILIFNEILPCEESDWHRLIGDLTVNLIFGTSRSQLVILYM
ncbi:AAEL007963-PA, partial [Aedes aegypti]